MGIKTMRATIDLKEVCGTDIVTREHGKKINTMIRERWEDGDEILVDFQNTSVASVSFLDEAIGVLALDYDIRDIVKRIHLVNITPFDQRLINDILQSRERQKKKKQKTA